MMNLSDLAEVATSVFLAENNRNPVLTQNFGKTSNMSTSALPASDVPTFTAPTFTVPTFAMLTSSMPTSSIPPTPYVPMFRHPAQQQPVVLSQIPTKVLMEHMQIQLQNTHPLLLQQRLQQMLAAGQQHLPEYAIMYRVLEQRLLQERALLLQQQQQHKLIRQEQILQHQQEHRHYGGDGEEAMMSFLRQLQQREQEQQQQQQQFGLLAGGGRRNIEEQSLLKERALLLQQQQQQSLLKGRALLLQQQQKQRFIQHQQQQHHDSGDRDKANMSFLQQQQQQQQQQSLPNFEQQLSPSPRENRNSGSSPQHNQPHMLVQSQQQPHSESIWESSSRSNNSESSNSPDVTSLGDQSAQHQSSPSFDPKNHFQDQLQGEIDDKGQEEDDKYLSDKPYRGDQNTEQTNTQRSPPLSSGLLTYPDPVSSATGLNRRKSVHIQSDSGNNISKTSSKRLWETSDSDSTSIDENAETEVEDEQDSDATQITKKVSFEDNEDILEDEEVSSDSSEDYAEDKKIKLTKNSQRPKLSKSKKKKRAAQNNRQKNFRNDPASILSLPCISCGKQIVARNDVIWTRITRCNMKNEVYNNVELKKMFTIMKRAARRRANHYRTTSVWDELPLHHPMQELNQLRLKNKIDAFMKEH